MYNHIVPQVLLKQFVENYPENKIIKFLDSSLTENKGSVRRTSGKEGFYSDEKELELGTYESKFGRVVKRIKERINQKYVSLEYQDYCNLLEFYTIQWRRTQYGRESKKEQLFDFSEKMYKLFEDLGFEKKEGVTRDDLLEKLEIIYGEREEEVIDIYEDEYNSITGVMFKSLNFYTPTLISNKTDIKFCLHDKVLTTLNTIDNLGGDFPETLIYPCTKEIFLLLQRSKQYVFKDRNVNIKVEKLKNDEEVEEFLWNYILGSCSKIYYVNGLDFIKKVYLEKKELMKELQMSNL